MIRALLVDDEAPARERLRRLLRPFEDVSVIGEAEDGPQAIERIAEHHPDVVFLDIQMPGCSGLEVAASLSAPRPSIVFCTAFDEYAVEAFEVHAVDYLLKPVSRARLTQTLERLRTGGGEAQRERALDGAAHAADAWPARYLARRSNRYYVVPRQEVLCFVSEGGQTKLQARDKHYWMQPTLAELEARLDPAAFFRVSRAAIVHLDAVDEVRPLPGGQGEIALAGGAVLEVSRRRFKDLLDRLGGGAV